jgi:hypothetical protein
VSGGLGDDDALLDDAAHLEREAAIDIAPVLVRPRAVEAAPPSGKPGELELAAWSVAHHARLERGVRVRDGTRLEDLVPIVDDRLPRRRAT